MVYILSIFWLWTTNLLASRALEMCKQGCTVLALFMLFDMALEFVPGIRRGGVGGGRVQQRPLSHAACLAT